ncbi:hypothetical protein CsSME_00016735 [Camellia sinensis var. sinensis]
MAARFAFFVVASALLLLHCFANSTDLDLEELGTAPVFSYSGNTGPDKWGSLSPLYATCSNGKAQSPIDIVKNKVVRNKNLKPLRREYYPANATLVNHGYNVGIQSKLAELAKEVFTNQDQIAVGTYDTWKLRRNTRKYYRYVGSLTTPPCTENVIWHIFGKERSISKEQIEALKAPVKATCKKNSRPVQPLNGRQIELFDEFS